MDICLRIFGTTIAQIKGLTATETVDDDSENQASVSLILFEPQHRPSFATIEVELSLFSLQKRMSHVEVFAEWEEHEVEDLFGFGDVDLESIMLGIQKLSEDSKKHFAGTDYAYPRYGFLLKGARRFRKPLVMRGKLGFFNVEYEG